MYQRCKMQPRALDNIDKCRKYFYQGQRVTKGYVLSSLLENYTLYTENDQILSVAIKESDIKQEGSGTAVNFNITADANEKLLQLKLHLDKDTGRSLFPAQIIDILLICAVNKIKTDLGKEDDENDVDEGIKNLFRFNISVAVADMLLHNMPEDSDYIEQIIHIMRKR